MSLATRNGEVSRRERSWNPPIRWNRPIHSTICEQAGQ